MKAVILFVVTIILGGAVMIGTSPQLKATQSATPHQTIEQIIKNLK